MPCARLDGTFPRVVEIGRNGVSCLRPMSPTLDIYQHRCIVCFSTFFFFSCLLPSQILVVAFSVLRMKRAVSRLNVLGLLFVLAGAVRYAVVSRREKKQREQRRGATSAGSGNKAAQRHHSNNGGSVAAAAAAAMSSGSSLLPTTVRLPAVDTATGVRAVMVNGKRAAKREECGAGSGGVKVEGGRVTTMALGSGWWGAENDDVSRRDR